MRTGLPKGARAWGFVVAGTIGAAVLGSTANHLQVALIPDGIACCTQTISGVARMDSFSTATVFFTSDQQIGELQAARAQGLRAWYRPALLLMTEPQLQQLVAAGGEARITGEAERMLRLRDRRYGKRHGRLLRVVRLDSLQRLERRRPAA